MELNGLLGSLLSPSTFGGSSPPKGLPARGDGATATADPSAGSGGVLAEISDAARSLFQQMKQKGIAAESFDLHLDLRALGMSVNASGSRSLEGHSLSVDLHISAHQGDQGKQLDISFELQETYFRASAGQRKDDQPSGGLVDNLKKLVDLLDKSDGQPEQTDGLGALLAQIGKALEAIAQRRNGSAGQAIKESNDQAGQNGGDAFQLQLDVHVRAISISQLVVVGGAGQADGAKQPQG